MRKPRLIRSGQRLRLAALALLRISSNSLDVIAVALLAVVVGYLAELSSSGNSLAIYDVPVLGRLELSSRDHLLIALTTVIIFLIKSFLGILGTWLSTRFFAELEIGWSVEIANNSFADSFAVESVSQFQNNVLNSTLALAMLFNSRLTIVTEAFLIIPMTLLFVVVDPILTTGALLYLLLLVTVINKFSLSRVKKYGKKNLYGLGEALKVSRDFFNVQREIAVSGEINRWLERLSSARRHAANSQASKAFIASLPRFVLEMGLVLAGAFFFAYISITSDIVSEASKIAIFTLGGFRILSAILPLQAAWISIVDAGVKSELAVNAVLESRQVREATTHKASKNSKLAVEIANVRLLAPGSQELILEVKELAIANGEDVAVFGPSGGGKTSLLELIAGLRSPSEGVVYRYGIPPRLSNKSESTNVRYVPQRPHLIHASLAENISLQDLEETDLSRCSQLLRELGLSKFSSQEILTSRILPDKATFSGGEIQRIGIARATYSPPKLLLLDEATSALDNDLEKEILEYLGTLEGLTKITVAHRLSTLSSAGKIIFVNEGRIVVGNSFDELCQVDRDARRLASHWFGSDGK